MRLLCITDLHGRMARLSAILETAGPVDAILLGGDITDFGSPKDAEKIVVCARQSGAPVFAVAGNCDSAEIDRHLVELGVSLSGRGSVCGSALLHGLSAMPPWRRGMYQFTEEELAASLEAGYAQIEPQLAAGQHVVLSHPPPRDTTLDVTIFGRHVGSSALTAFLHRTQPALVVCGHIHEGRGIEQMGNTVAVNCGLAASGEYALADVGQQVSVALHVAYHA
jgi:uncharacterized protein